MITYIKFWNDEFTLHNDKKFDLENLYKKCGFKKEDNFVKLFSYNFNENNLEFWGRNKGDTKSINTYNLSHYNYNNNIYGKFLCLIKNKESYINFDKNYFQDINKRILELYNKNITANPKDNQNKNENENINNITNDEIHSENNDEQDDSHESESDSSESDPIYDSELQYEEYDYSSD